MRTLALRSWLVLWVVCGVCGAAEALRFDFAPSPLERLGARQDAQRRRLVCPRGAQPPKIDGVLDDAAWRQAAVIQRLHRGGPATEVRLCFDDQALYIAVRCTQPKAKPLTAPRRERDEAVWKDDCIEVWLDPGRKGTLRYQFIVNPTGSFFDQTLRGNAGDTTFDPAWERAATQAEGQWVLEMALPPAALGLKRWPQRMGFNIGRNGPGLTPRAWCSPYGDTSAGDLVFQGVQDAGAVRDEGPAAAADERAMSAAGESLRLSIERLFARPGDRWLEVGLHLAPTRAALGKTRVHARLYGLAEARPVAEASAVPARAQGALWVDLRRVGLSRARLVVELAEDGRRTGVAEAFLSARACETPLAPGQKIHVSVDVPEGIGAVEAWPTTFGVPFPAGALWDASQVRLVDRNGREIPAQTEVTGRWGPEGAIQWLRFDALVTSRDGCLVEVARPTAKPAKPVAVAERDGKVVLETGVARYVLARGPSPIEEIHLGGQRVATSAGTRGLFVVDQTGRVASASADGEEMLIEARGPVAACVRFEGFYRTAKGEQLARHITRVEAYAGQPFAKVTHTLVLTNDTNTVWFRDVGWEFAVEPGAKPSAVFGVSRDEWAKSLAQPLDAKTPSAFMLQDRHYVFAHGDNHFLVSAVGADGKAGNPLAEGTECGDWAALAGDRAALAVACRDAARQHPKEFEVARDRVVLHLFSPRGGEELDFRAPTLMKKWDVTGWFDHAYSKNFRDKSKQEEVIKGLASNAIGWAKTHELLVAPLAPEAPAKQAARLARLHAQPVYGHPSPRWVCQSEAMGPIHPRDPARFPCAEELIDETFKVWERRVGTWGDYGFVDYFGGPHLAYRGKYILPKRYYRYTYTLRHDLWLLFARSGDRRIRALAEGTNRSYLDNILCHWDGDGKVRGLYVTSATPDVPLGNNQGSLPFYWHGAPAMTVSSSSNLNQFIWLYHLTGYRRARDAVVAYGEALKRWWTPAKARRCWRGLMATRLLAQAYGLTHDPALRALTEANTDTFVDPQGAIGLTKNRPYTSSTYKTQVDVAGLLDAWEITGTPRYRDLALKISRFWWTGILNDWPIFYCDPLGRIGNFLYRETGDPAYAQGLLVKMREAASAYDPATGKVKANLDGRIGAHEATFVFQGIPYAQDVIVRTNADETPTASWVAWDGLGYPTSVVAFKRSEDTLDIELSGGDAELRLLRAGTTAGMNLNEVRRRSDGSTWVRVPKDAPEGAYELVPKGEGTQFVLCHSRTPLVLHAPGYWRPMPTQRPQARWFFTVPKGTRDGQVLFEGTARLFDPAGKPFGGGEPLHGWIDLPPDKPGLWGFEPARPGLVRVRNVPPFFAAGNPTSYFEPPIPWEREPIPPAPKPVPKGTVFVPGAIDTPGNQALFIRERHPLMLEVGPPHPSGDGGRFLPFQQGTIEFFVKPTWGTVDSPEKCWKCLLRVRTPKEPWNLQYMKSPGQGAWFLSHVLYGYLMTEGPKRRVSLRAYRQTVVERGRWTHIAWVWGKEDTATFKYSKRTRALRAQIFVDGKAGRQLRYNNEGNRPSDRPLRLELGSTAGGAYDELRVSDVRRYTADFAPPSRDRELRPDEHTRALFHFNGDLAGESHGHAGPLPAKLRP